MASDQELRTLINTIVTDQRAARRFMSRFQERPATSRLNISDDQSKDVARSLGGSRLSGITWPDAKSASFEIPIQRS
ncbi:MAG: hypothetical protein P8M20_12580 [Planctomycetaceae bacterium]|nr:hypothetical protein [Planctomycetaceae bacterium]